MTKGIKGAGPRKVNNRLVKRRFCSIFLGHITVIFYYFSQNESGILKIDSCTSQKNKRNTHMLYDCRDIGGFLE